MSPRATMIGRNRPWLLLALFAYWLGAVSVVAAAAAAPDETLVKLQQRVSQVPVLRGEFSQEKQLHGFRNPLRSQGEFVVARGRGVIWSTLRPFPSTLVLTGERVLSQQADGSRRVELDARQQPTLRAVNTMLMALVSGDAKALSERFELDPELLEGDRWQLRMVPRTAALAKAFRQIQLEGDRHVRRVTIEEASGDRSILDFSAMRETPEALSDDEARRLE